MLLWLLACGSVVAVGLSLWRRHRMREPRPAALGPLHPTASTVLVGVPWHLSIVDASTGGTLHGPISCDVRSTLTPVFVVYHERSMRALGIRQNGCLGPYEVVGLHMRRNSSVQSAPTWTTILGSAQGVCLEWGDALIAAGSTWVASQRSRRRIGEPMCLRIVWLDRLRCHDLHIPDVLGAVAYGSTDDWLLVFLRRSRLLYAVDVRCYASTLFSSTSLSASAAIAVPCLSADMDTLVIDNPPTRVYLCDRAFHIRGVIPIGSARFRGAAHATTEQMRQCPDRFVRIGMRHGDAFKNSCTSASVADDIRAHVLAAIGRRLPCLLAAVCADYVLAVAP